MSHQGFSSPRSTKAPASLFVVVVSVTETIKVNSPSVGLCLAYPKDVMMIHHMSGRAVNNSTVKVWGSRMTLKQFRYCMKLRLRCAVEQSASFVSVELSVSFKVKHWQGVRLHNLTHHI